MWNLHKKPVLGQMRSANSQSLDKSDYEIVKTIISLGQSMNIELIAEGIETAAHQASLQELGCLYGQGYYYSKPLPPEQFIQYLQVGKH